MSTRAVSLQTVRGGQNHQGFCAGWLPQKEILWGHWCTKTWILSQEDDEQLEERASRVVCCVTRSSSSCASAAECPGTGRDGVRAAALPKQHCQGCWVLALLSLQRGKENHKPPCWEGDTFAQCSEVTPGSHALLWAPSLGESWEDWSGGWVLGWEVRGRWGTGERKAPPAAAASGVPGEMELHLQAAAGMDGEGAGRAGLGWRCPGCHGSLGVLPAAAQGPGRERPLRPCSSTSALGGGVSKGVSS